MFDLYLVTGASGFLGRAVIQELLKKGAAIRALAVWDDPLAEDLPSSVQIVSGDVRDEASLKTFFKDASRRTCVIHCAGLVSVASHPGDNIYQVNVQGTMNILKYCMLLNVGKMIYVCSVHALPEKSQGRRVMENDRPDPYKVQGDYAKSKAAAALHVFEAARQGLNASIVYPSGLIGPNDTGYGSLTCMLSRFLHGKLPFAVKGGYDFVDVRDVASGIVACTEHGQPGQGYILSGHYATIAEILRIGGSMLGLRRRVLFLPVPVAKIAAYLYEKKCLRAHQPLFFTPLAVSVLASNAHFSQAAARTDLHFQPRPLVESIGDTILWLKDR